jgi:putative acetyltransferase
LHEPAKMRHILAMQITMGDFQNPQVQALLKHHLEGMRANSPICGVHALDLSGLQKPEIAFWTVWDGNELMGCGALKDLGNRTGEIKSMRTWPQHVRKGVAKAMLTHIMATARERGYKHLSLETGSGPAFEPALALYRTHGFKAGGAFADYVKSEFSQFLHLEL